MKNRFASWYPSIWVFLCDSIKDVASYYQHDKDSELILISYISSIERPRSESEYSPKDWWGKTLTLSCSSARLCKTDLSGIALDFCYDARMVEFIEGYHVYLVLARNWSEISYAVTLLLGLASSGFRRLTIRNSSKMIVKWRFNDSFMINFRFSIVKLHNINSYLY